MCCVLVRMILGFQLGKAVGQSPAQQCAGGKSGHRRAERSVTLTCREAGKVPQKTDRLFL